MSQDLVRTSAPLSAWDPKTRSYQPAQRAHMPAEVRDPSAATTPIRYQGLDTRMVPEWDAENAIRWGYLANVFVYACIRAIATDLSSLAFRVGADPDKPADYDPKHPLAKLLGPAPGGPNPTVSARRLWAWTVANRIVAGRHAWELETTGAGGKGDIVGIWPLVTSMLDAIPSRSGTRYFDRFEYGRPEAKKRLRAEQVFYAWRPSLSDWRQPESELQAARLDISVAVMQDRYDHAFLRNDARPAAVIVHEAFAETAERDAFRQQFLAEHRGPDNAGRPAFVEASEDGAEVTKAIAVQVLGLSQTDAKFIERYEAKVRGICVGIGVPLSRLMDASKRTFSNADRETVNYWHSTVLNLALDLADDVNVQLAPRFGDNVGWFDTSKVPALQAPSRFTPISVGEAYEARIATLNEARREVGLSEVDGGDEFAGDAEANADAAERVAAAERELREAQERAAEAERRHHDADARLARIRQANLAGVMVAFYPQPDAAEALAVGDGEPVEQLHLTLAYLGMAADLEDRDAVTQALATFAASSPPVDGIVSGTGAFEAGEERAVVALVDAPALPEWRGRLVAALEAAGIEVDRTHGFTPHITLAYTDADDVEAPAGLDLRFDTVSLSWGRDRVDFTLRGERSAPGMPDRSAVAEQRTEQDDRDLADFHGLTIDGVRQRAWTDAEVLEAREARQLRHNEPDEAERARLAELRRSHIWRSVDAQVTTLEGAWTRGMRAMFERQEAATVKRLESKRGRKVFDPDYGIEYRAPGETREVTPDPSVVFDVEFWRADTTAVASPLFEAVMAVGGARVAEVFGIAFDIEAPYAADFIAARANQLAGRVTDTTYGAIQEQLAAGAAAGEGIPDLAARVRSVFAEASAIRARTIARTEVLSAFNGSASLVAAQLPAGVVAGQEWIASRDSRVRSSHAVADGQVQGIGQPFSVGGVSLAYPGDPNGPADEVVNCRCSIAFLTPEDMAARQTWKVEIHVVQQLIVKAAAGQLDADAVRREMRAAA